MRAAIVTPDLSQPPVRAGDWPEPTPPTGWVTVRVERAALNRNDALWLSDRHELPAPSVIGSDAAGVVAALGEGVSGVTVGDEVVVLPSLRWGDDEDAPGPGFELLGWPTQGAHAELLTVPAENVFPKPSRLSWEEAAALPLAGLTAWRALVVRGGLQKGQTVVVTGASSGVGTYVVQLAAALGARVVVITSSEEKVAELRGLGADEGMLRDDRDFAGTLERLVDGKADLVVDAAGARWLELTAVLRRGGRLVSYGRSGSSTGELSVNRVFWEHLSVLGSSMGSPRDFAALLDHVEQSTWAPLIDSVLGLEDIVGAYARLDHPDRIGKVVLAPGS